MSVYIEIRDTDNSIVGRLDVGDSDNYPLSLTRKISDYTQLNARSGVFSTDFEVPLTQTNAQLFSGITNVNLKNTKQFFKEKDAIIYSNNLQVYSGKIQVLDIKTSNDVKYLTMNFIGNNLEWTTKLAEMALNEVNFADNVFNYDSTSVKASWTNTADDSDFVFAYIDRGEVLSNPSVTTTTDFRPDLFVKRILDTAFNQIGFNLSSTFFSTTGFKSLILPYFGSNEEDWVLQDSDIVNSIIKVGNTTSKQTGFINSFETRFWGSPTGAGGTYECSGDLQNLPLTVDAGGVFQDPNNTYDTTSYEFNNFTEFGNWDFDYRIKITDIEGGALFSESDRFELWFEYTNTGIVDRQQLASFGGTTGLNQVYEDTVNTYVTPSGTGGTARFYVKYFAYNGDNYQLNDCAVDRRQVKITVSSDSQITATRSSLISNASSLQLSNVLPKNYHVLELINDLTKMFNLYWETDTKTKTVSVEPRDDFFQDITTATDYTSKIDLSNEYVLTDYSSIYKRYLKFDYADDGRDGYVTKLNEERLGKGLPTVGGVDNIDLSNNFEDGTNSLAHDKIAGTAVIGSYGNNGLKAFTARLWSNYGVDRPAFSSNFAPRILSFKYAQQPSFGTYREFSFVNESTGLIETITTIPYALPRAIVENGGLVAEVDEVLTYANSYKDLTTREGLIENYYSGTIESMKEGKNLKINMLLSFQEFNDLDFSKPIYFSAPEDIQGYWNIESINNMMLRRDSQIVQFSLNKKINTEPLYLGEDVELLEEEPDLRERWRRSTDYPFTATNELATTLDSLENTQNNNE